MPLLPTVARAAATGVRAECSAASTTSPQDERNGDREPGARHSLDLLAWFDFGAGIRLYREERDSRFERANRRKRPGHGGKRFSVGWYWDSERCGGSSSFPGPLRLRKKKKNPKFK